MITYKRNEPIHPEDALDLYRRSGLNRPRELERIQNMLQHANVLITAWDDAKLVGLLRAMTDFSFDCYLNDLCVDPNYQRQGIGRAMVNQLKGLLDDNVLIMLLSSPTALDFYKTLGFTTDSDAYGQIMCLAV